MIFIISLLTKNDTLRNNILIDIQTTLRKWTIPLYNVISYKALIAGILITIL